MFSISEEELRDKPEVNKGDVFLHKECGQLHELRAAGENEDDDTILWFKCGDKTILGALNRKWLW